MRVLIIDQCSGLKDAPDWFEKYTAEEVDAHSRAELLNEVRDRVPGLRAEKLYTGRQQQFITEAVNQLREAGDEVNRVFISAGFGVVNSTTELPPYEVTFGDYTAAEIQDRGRELAVESDLRSFVNDSEPYDVVFFALGSAYLKSFDVRSVLSELPPATLGVIFNQDEVADSFDQVCSLPARTAQAKQFGTIVVALKGVYLRNFSKHRSQGAEPATVAEVAKYCTSSPTSQSTLGS